MGTKVFRYLDPSGEGQVSESEWAVLTLLQNEIHLSVWEFVKFLQRSFGNDIREWWDQLDEDGGGEIDFDEWMHVCHSLGYFGATRPIFKFVDKDDEGTISLDEFLELE